MFISQRHVRGHGGDPDGARTRDLPSPKTPNRLVVPGIPRLFFRPLAFNLQRSIGNQSNAACVWTRNREGAGVDSPPFPRRRAAERFSGVASDVAVVRVVVVVVSVDVVVIAAPAAVAAAGAAAVFIVAASFLASPAVGSTPLVALDVWVRLGRFAGLLALGSRVCLGVYAVFLSPAAPALVVAMLVAAVGRAAATAAFTTATCVELAAVAIVAVVAVVAVAAVAAVAAGSPSVCTGQQVVVAPWRVGCVGTDTAPTGAVLAARVVRPFFAATAAAAAVALFAAAAAAAAAVPPTVAGAVAFVSGATSWVWIPSPLPFRTGAAS